MLLERLNYHNISLFHIIIYTIEYKKQEKLMYRCRASRRRKNCTQ